MMRSTKLALGNRPGFCGLAIALTCGIAVPALAQGTAQTDQASDYQNREIVVTARSTGETLTEVPVAVTALSSADIERYASADLVKMSQLTPQVEVYGSGAGSGGAFLVRGIGTTADTAGVDQSVSISLDGSQIARPRTAVASMFDLEQVAILKGPQALFFGKNSSAGVIQLSTANPTADLSGYVTGGYEFKARERYVNAAISIPLTDTLGVRFAGRFTKMRGYVHNLGESKIDPIGVDPMGGPVLLPDPKHRWGPGTEEIAGRITLKWDPSSNYSTILKATFNKLTDNGGTSTTEAVCAGAHPTHLGIPDLNSECKLNGIRHVTDLPALYANGPFSDPRWFDGVPFTDSRSKFFTWQQSLDLGAVLLTANTGYSTLKFATRGPYSSTEFAEFSGGVTEDYKGFSQEVRLITQLDGPFNVTAGGYYEKTKTEVTSALFLYNFGPDIGCPTLAPCTPTGSYQSGTGEATARSRAWSIFGQARWDITPEIELAVGARYTKTRKTAVQGQPRYVHYIADARNVGGFLLPEGTTLNSRLNEDNWSPEATITWHPTPDSTLYAAYKTGYKSGGIALPTVVTAADTNTSVVFNPEKSKGGEIGYKANLMDRRLRVGVTAYYYKFSGLQLTSYDPVTSAYKIQNAADAKQKGIEAEAEFSVTPELTLRAAASYNSVKYGAFENSSCYANQTVAEGCVGGVQDLSGRTLHRAPKFSASGGFSYDTLVSNGLMIGLNGDIRYTSSAYALETQSPISKQKSYALINAGVRVYSEDKTWELALIGRNLTNKRLIGFIQDKPGAVIPGVNEANIYGTRPRELALQGTLRF